MVRRKRILVALLLLSLAAAGCGKKPPPGVVEEGLAAFGRNAGEARAILGPRASAEKVEAMVAASRAISRATTIATNSDDVLRAARSTESDVVTIVAHNSGESLRFGDGSALPIASLARELPADGSGPLLVLIGCNTAINGLRIVGLESELPLAAGVEIRTRFRSWLGTLERKPSFEETQSELDAIADAVAADENTRLIGQGSTTRLVVGSSVALAGSGAIGVTVTENI